MKSKLWIVAGPNGAGKTTLVSKFNRKRIPVINPDDIALQWPDLPERQKHLRAGRSALLQRRKLFENCQDFIVETTFSGKGALSLLREAQDKRYRVFLVAVLIPSDTASLGRVAERVKKGGHDVPVEAIVRRFGRSIANISHAIKTAERAYIIDNTGAKGRFVAVIEKGRYKKKYPGAEKIMRRHFPSLIIGKNKAHGLSM